MTNPFLEKYSHFVDTLLSDPSKNLELFINRITQLQNDTGVDITRLATGSDGLCSESGELKEIVKKVFWQGKPLDQQSQFHIERELGDIIFYWMVVCQALNISAERVIKENVVKLEARYPGGNFDINYSEKRKIGDL